MGEDLNDVKCKGVSVTKDYQGRNKRVIAFLHCMTHSNT